MSDMHIVESLIDNFTMVGNSFARDPQVTPRACRLYVYLMSHAAGWKLSVKAAQNATGMGRGTVYSAINDLRKLGYVRRIDLKNENGHFSGTQYQVMAHPLPEHERDDVEGKLSSHVPKCETRDNQPKQDETPGGNRLPKIGIPKNGIPGIGTHKNNNSKKTNDQEDQYKKDMLIPDGKSVTPSNSTEVSEPGKDTTQASEKKTPADKYPKEFLEWYAIYPRKKAKGDALKAYRQALKEIDHDALVEKTRKFARYVEQTQEPAKYVPYPATWLRASQWDDELETPEAPRMNPGGQPGGRKPSALDIVRGMIAQDSQGQTTWNESNNGQRELNW